jgi:hypothetical protein
MVSPGHLREVGNHDEILQLGLQVLHADSIARCPVENLLGQTPLSQLLPKRSIVFTSASAIFVTPKVDCQ